jgi:hypothetical protein
MAFLAGCKNADGIVLVGRRKATFHRMAKMEIKFAVLQFQTLRCECMDTALIQSLNILPHDLLLPAVPFRAFVFHCLNEAIAPSSKIV